MCDFSERLKQLMEEYKLTQADICRETGISKGLMSMYLSGARNPKQNNITAIAKRYNVSELWLMGLTDSKVINKKIDVEDATLDAKISNDKVLKESIKKYYNLSAEKQRQVIDFIEFLSK